MGLLSSYSPAWAGLNSEEIRRARLLRVLLQALFAATLLIYVAALTTINPWVSIAAASVLVGIEAGSWLLLRSGHVNLAAWTIIAGLWAALTAAALIAPAQGNVPFVGFILLSAGAGLLLGAPAAFLTAVLSILSAVGYLAASANRLLPAAWLSFTPEGEFIAIGGMILAAAGLSSLANLALKDAVAETNAAAEMQRQAADEMESIRSGLENQVVERTRDLERRTRYLQAATEVSRAAAVILDPHTLMQSAVDLILERFALYYTGVFLNEPGGEWALLQAGTGEAGRRMVERGHRIRVGSGMVGWSIANAQPRIALDVGHDAVRLATAELPETRSEAAIPLRSRGKVLGALTVQSRLPAAFGEVEIAIFQSLADQLAIALDNARLLSESQQALEQAQRAYRQASGRAWREFLNASGPSHIRYHYGQVDTSAAPADPADVQGGDGDAGQARRRAILSCQPVQCILEGKAVLFLPVQSRDQVVGLIRMTKEQGQDPDLPLEGWSEEEVDLLQTISGQIGAALDAARLYQDTQRAAAREQVTGEVTARIRQTLDMQTVLRTAVEEIQRHLNLPEVVISLSASDELAEEVGQ